MGIDKFTIIGFSMGGRSGMKAAMKYPDRVTAMMPVDSPAISFDVFPGYADR